MASNITAVYKQNKKILANYMQICLLPVVKACKWKERLQFCSCFLIQIFVLCLPSTAEWCLDVCVCGRYSDSVCVFKGSSKGVRPPSFFILFYPFLLFLKRKFALFVVETLTEIFCSDWLKRSWWFYLHYAMWFTLSALFFFFFKTKITLRSLKALRF